MWEIRVMICQVGLQYLIFEGKPIEPGLVPAILGLVS